MLHSLDSRSAPVIGHEINIGIDLPLGPAIFHVVPCSAWQNVNDNGKGDESREGRKNEMCATIEATVEVLYHVYAVPDRSIVYFSGHCDHYIIYIIH